MVTIKLRDIKYSPWGILTEEQFPRIIIWLTEVCPEWTIDETLLAEEQLEMIRMARNERVIELDKDIFKEDVSEPILPAIDIMEVSGNLRKEPTADTFLDNKYDDEVKEILKLNVSRAVKVFKNKNKKGEDLAFFQACKRIEEEDKKRKTVIRFLTDLIEERLSQLQSSGPRIDPHTKETLLDSLYSDMIVEEEYDPTKR